MNELKETMKGILKDRFDNPFLTKLIIAWSVINWKVLYITLFVSEKTLNQNKLDYIVDNLLNNWCKSTIYPILLAIIFFIFDESTKKLNLYFKALWNKWLNKFILKVNNERPYMKSEVDEMIENETAYLNEKNSKNEIELLQNAKKIESNRKTILQIQNYRQDLMDFLYKHKENSLEFTNIVLRNHSLMESFHEFISFENKNILIHQQSENFQKLYTMLQEALIIDGPSHAYDIYIRSPKQLLLKFSDKGILFKEFVEKFTFYSKKYDIK